MITKAGTDFLLRLAWNTIDRGTRCQGYNYVVGSTEYDRIQSRIHDECYCIINGYTKGLITEEEATEGLAKIMAKECQ